MSVATTELHAARSQAEKIVTRGADIRPRLAEVVTNSACRSQQAGEGMVALIRAIVDGAREGLDRSVPTDRDDVLRQVVDALGDGLSRTALAGQLALQEAASSARQYAREDLVRLNDDLAAVRDLFAETVNRGLTTCKTLTADQVAAAKAHAERVAEGLRPVFTEVLDAVRQHPLDFARQGLQTGVTAGQHAAGSLFQSLGHMLERTGEQLRRGGDPMK